MDKVRLNLFAQKLTAIQTVLSQLENDVEEIRSYYKYQNSDTDSSSESLIITFTTLSSDVDHSIDRVNDLIDYEEDLECVCEEEE